MVTSVFLSAVTRIPMSLEERLGVGFMENWEIEDRALVNCDVRAWLKLPSTPSDI